ncbi:MAG: threonine--tRNA ligase [bacterium]|nr:threonine--tRNA ligase [bacterium]
MSENNFSTLRHSCSHVLAAAILKLYPETKLGIGPAIENGFYYDFQLPKPISEEDFPEITKVMEEILKDKVPFIREEISISEAEKLFAKQPFKLELIRDLAKDTNKTVSIYRTGVFVDLCAGPHLENSSEIGAFKLLSVAGAYWRGSEKNPMLTRIYGTCFPTLKELDEHLEWLEETKKRDHRVIGKKLDLFVFTDIVGKGLPLFTEKGSIIRRELEKFVVEEETKRGYHHVYTPELARVELYKTSGHYPYYKDTMYPVMKIDDEELILRPMTCPHHFQLYLSKPRSYKDLPLRFAELAKQFRYEKSGELTGLMRVRAFCLADAHIICRQDQATDEINQVLDLIEYFASALGLEKVKDYRYRLSLGKRDDEKKYFKDDTSWDFSEDILREVLAKRQAPSFEAEGEAAFYGPKIDIQMKNFAGKEETAFTVQYDFVMPKRFKMEYVNQEGKKEEPIVIHRSSIGAIERVMALLIEHYAGAFPVWLAPVQAVVIPITDDQNDYAKEIVENLQNEEIRVELDDRNETTSSKIRDSEMQKVPYMLIVGKREVEAGNISVRARGEKDLGQSTLDQFIEQIKSEIENKS